MGNRKKYESHARAEDAGRHPPTTGSSTLLQRLLQKIGSPQEQDGASGRARPLPPAGRRSGSGTESLGPYLDETRNTRPGPLE
jgi:hypothetical protein